MRRLVIPFFLASLALPPPPPQEPSVWLRQDALEAQFHASALAIHAGAHEARLRLLRAGCEGTGKELAPTPPTARGQRVSYQHEEAGVEEWYTRDDRGIEQGFTFRQAPEGCTQPSLHLEVGVEGALRPVLGARGDHVLFRDTSGAARLAYSELHAFDRTGRELPSRMSVDGGRIALDVDTRGATFPVVVDPLIGTPTQSLTGPTLKPQFGVATATDGTKWLAVGEPENGEMNAPNAGAVYLYDLSTGGWNFEKKLVDNPPSQYSNCGSSLAMGGGLLLVGCPGDGHVSVWDLSGSSPSYAADLAQGTLPTTPGFGLLLGVDDTIAVAYNPSSDFGGLHVFKKLSPASWSKLDTLYPDPMLGYPTSLVLSSSFVAMGFPNGSLGSTVEIWDRTGATFASTPSFLSNSSGLDNLGTALATDGTRLFIGAPENGGGALWIGEQSAGVWKLSKKIDAPGGASNFGGAVTFDAIKQRLVVLSGTAAEPRKLFAYKVDGQGNLSQDAGGGVDVGAGQGVPISDPGGLSSGAGNVFAGSRGGSFQADGRAVFFKDSGNALTRLGEILPVPEGSPGDLFGASMARDGNLLLVGAPGSKVFLQEQGLVSLFRKEGGQWKRTQVLNSQASPSAPPSESSGDQFGASVALKGCWGFVGFPELPEEYGGGVLALRCQNPQLPPETQPWQQAGYLSISNANASGAGSQLSFDGTTLAVGMPEAPNGGAASLFTFNGSAWVEEIQLTPSDIVGASGVLKFGVNTAVDGTTLLVSSTNANNNAGEVYRFEKINGSWSFQGILSEPGGAKSNRYFGVGLALDIAQKRAFINANSSAGIAGGSAVYVFDTALWTSVQTIPHPENQLFFGAVMKVQDNLLAVSSDNGNGEAFFYKRLPDLSWQLLGQVNGVAPGVNTSLELDGYSFLVGDPSEGDPQGPGQILVGNLPFENGTPCTLASDCESNFCVDGVCCDIACDAACMACSALQNSVQDGSCLPAIQGSDDPLCEPNLPCGFTGQCNSTGQCAFAAAETVCGVSCDNQEGTSSLVQSTCDGQGFCVEQPPISCGVYQCVPQGEVLSCLSSCETNNDCVAPATCVGTQCVGLAPLGSPCELAGDCQSGFCADGVCCGVACDGGCEACAVAKGASKDGECSALCPASQCENDTCQQGGAGGSSGSSGQGGKGLPDLWTGEPVTVGGASSVGGSSASGGTESTAGTSSEGGTAGGYQRPKVSPLSSVEPAENGGCGCRTAGSPASGNALAGLAMLGLLVARRHRARAGRGPDQPRSSLIS